MIGTIKTTRTIPPGAVIQFDTDRNELLIFDGEGRRVHVYVLSVPFVVDTLERDPRTDIARFISGR